MSTVALPLEARRCPLCAGAMRASGSGYDCTRCARAFPVTAHGQGDFRLGSNESVTWSASYRPIPIDRTVEVCVARERRCPEPRNAYAGEVPWHMTRDQISYLPQAEPGQIALDLGCGTGLHRPLLEALGYRHYGVDYHGDGARDLVDAHALPFVDSTFDLVVAIALLEHVAQPRRAISEMCRVLKLGCYAVGTVAFLEPFHDNSFYHFSPLGLQSALEGAGFTVETILSIRGWNVLRAQLEMGFERASLPRFVPALLAGPFVGLVEAYALVGRAIARDKRRHGRDIAQARHAGAFFYVARRPPFAGGSSPG
jgi:SAM-dependent methyltransferase